jgi:hypothetical protein
MQIKDVFGMERENYLQVFRDIKDTYIKLLKRVQDSNLNVQKYYNKYCKYYNETLILHSKNKTIEKDMYNKEMKYR